MQQELLQDFDNNLMIMLLLQATDNNHPDHPIHALHPDWKPTSMNGIIIRRRPAIRTLQRVLFHKGPLHLRCTTTGQHLTPHQPGRQAPAQHGIPLAPHPDLIIDDGAGLRGALEDDVRLRGATGHQRDGDQSRFALVRREGKDARAQG